MADRDRKIQLDPRTQHLQPGRRPAANSISPERSWVVVDGLKPRVRFPGGGIQHPVAQRGATAWRLGRRPLRRSSPPGSTSSRHQAWRATISAHRSVPADRFHLPRAGERRRGVRFCGRLQSRYCRCQPCLATAASNPLTDSAQNHAGQIRQPVHARSGRRQRCTPWLSSDVPRSFPNRRRVPPDRPAE